MVKKRQRKNTTNILGFDCKKRAKIEKKEKYLEKSERQEEEEKNRVNDWC